MDKGEVLNYAPELGLQIAPPEANNRRPRLFDLGITPTGDHRRSPISVAGAVSGRTGPAWCRILRAPHLPNEHPQQVETTAVVGSELAGRAAIFNWAPSGHHMRVATCSVRVRGACFDSLRRGSAREARVGRRGRR